MGYKDKDKQREANRKAQAKFKAKGITQGITSEGITEKVLPTQKEFLDTLDAIEQSDPPEVNLELCRTCGELLPPLENPRKYPGRCLSCVTGKVEVGG